MITIDFEKKLQFNIPKVVVLNHRLTFFGNVLPVQTKIDFTKVNKNNYEELLIIAKDLYSDYNVN